APGRYPVTAVTAPGRCAASRLCGRACEKRGRPARAGLGAHGPKLALRFAGARRSEFRGPGPAILPRPAGQLGPCRQRKCQPGAIPLKGGRHEPILTVLHFAFREAPVRRQAADEGVGGNGDETCTHLEAPTTESERRGERSQLVRSPFECDSARKKRVEPSQE